MEKQPRERTERERHSDYILLAVDGGYLAGWVSRLNLDNAVAENSDTLVLCDPATRMVSQVLSEQGPQITHVLVELGIAELKIRWAHVAAWTVLPEDGDLVQIHRELVARRESGLVLPPAVRARRGGQA